MGFLALRRALLFVLVSVTHIRGGGGLGGEKIDVDKFRSPPSYQIFLLLCAMLCTSNTGCREGFLCAACSANA